VKNKVIYIFLFIIAFIFTTGGIVFFNSIYQDIFKYDFKLTATAASDTTNSANIDDSTKTMNASLAISQPDSLKTLSLKNPDSLHVFNSKDSASTDSLKRQQNIIKPSIIQASFTKTQDSTQFSVENTKTKPDSNYIVWMKQTAKMYESMDPKKAAKIIQSYSDNIARDIIYSMKQKKAADILSELSPDTATRITRAKSNAF